MLSAIAFGVIIVRIPRQRSFAKGVLLPFKVLQHTPHPVLIKLYVDKYVSVPQDNIFIITHNTPLTTFSNFAAFFKKKNNNNNNYVTIKHYLVVCYFQL